MAMEAVEPDSLPLAMTRPHYKQTGLYSRSERAGSSGFVGMRGRRSQEMDKRAAFMGMRGKKAPFNGMRGKKSSSYLPYDFDTLKDEEFDYSGLRDKKAPFNGMRGKKSSGSVDYSTPNASGLGSWWQSYMDFTKRRSGNYNGFVGMRG